MHVAASVVATKQTHSQQGSRNRHIEFLLSINVILVYFRQAELASLLFVNDILDDRVLQQHGKINILCREMLN